jgi:hypothetical protein
MLTIDNIIETIKQSDNLSSLYKSLNKNEDLRNYIINKTPFLNNVTIYEHVFCIKNNINSISKCTICNTNKLIFDLKYKKYKNWCSIDCKKQYMILNKDPEKELLRIEKIKNTRNNFTDEKNKQIINKQKQTNIERYGADSYAKTDQFKNYMLNTYGYISPFELKETHNKSKETLKKKYKVDHNFKIEGIQERIENTFIENYGTNRPAKNKVVRDKIIKTNNELYGANSPMCNDEIKQKAKDMHLSNYEFYGLSNPETLKKYKQTMMDRYGYENVLHNDEMLHKILLSSKKYKIYKFPSGKEVFVQGYEDYVIEQLLNKYNESDIIISNKEISESIGKIFYNIDNNQHKYYPDIYIKSENKIIEVKSEYTYNKDLEINLLKEKSCIEKGINFEFMIIDKIFYNKWKKNKQTI